jgi:hypothetical protein
VLADGSGVEDVAESQSLLFHLWLSFHWLLSFQSPSVVESQADMIALFSGYLVRSQVMSSKRSYPKKLERLNQLYNDGFEEWFDPDEEVEEAHGHSHATMEKGIKRARV